MRSFFALAIFLSLGACAQRGPLPVEPAIIGKVTSPVPDAPSDTIHLVEFSALTGWEEGDHLPALRAFRDACDDLGSGAASEPLGGVDTAGGTPLFGTVADWSPICAKARKASDAKSREFFEEWFLPVSVGKAGLGEALFTAYYEPELSGARRQGGPYQYPLYRRPPDLRKGVPYLDRAAIDGGALAGKGLEIFWLDDPVEAFFLHIQGSGRIRLPDGSIARVGYADKNNRAYKAIGKTLVEWGEMELEEVSTKSIKDWIAANPQRRDALFASNPSYVFFVERKELASDPSLGPVGSFGQPLPPQRAIAVDRRYYPLGAPGWIEFASPVGPIRRLTVALDTGGAIKGPRRADFFFGSGDAAGLVAGETRAKGRLIVFAPRSVIERLRAGS